MQYQFCGISVAFRTCWIAKEHHYPECTPRQSVTHPGINPVQQDLTSLGHYFMRLRLFVPEQGSVQTLKSYGIMIDIRSTSHRTGTIRRERTKHGALLHGARNEVPKWSTPKIIYWSNLILYQHGEVFRCTYLLLQFNAVHKLAAILKLRRHFMYPL